MKPDSIITYQGQVWDTAANAWHTFEQPTRFVVIEDKTASETHPPHFRVRLHRDAPPTHYLIFDIEQIERQP